MLELFRSTPLRSTLALFVASVVVATACAGTDEDSVAGNGLPKPTADSGSGAQPGIDGAICEGPSCELPSACSSGSECPMGYLCEAGACVPGSECGKEEFEQTPVVPNLFISLDRSCSMNQKATPGGASKWNEAVTALSTLTAKFKGKIRWGLSLFPDKLKDAAGSKCFQETNPLDCAKDNEAALVQRLTAFENVPGEPCITPINGAVLEMQQTLEIDPNHPTFAVLITDGKQRGCGLEAGAEEARQMLVDLAKDGIKTFVVGFGNGVDAAELDSFAEAGGVPKTGGSEKYYQAAATAKDLEQVMTAIGQTIISCEVQLSQVPDNQQALFVFIDDVGVANDAQNGWSYDPAKNTIQFHGAACSSLQQKPDADIDIVFGCNAPTPS